MFNTSQNGTRPYFIHTTTKNISFVKMYRTLKDLSVQNNKFFLALYDKDLESVDPFSPLLSDNMKLKIYTEIIRNKWYFLREIVRIPQAGKTIPYELNLGNLSLSFLKAYNINVILILPRQHGKTVGEIIEDIYIYDFATTNNNTLYLNKSHDSAKGNLKLFKDIRLGYPDWLKDFVMDPNDTDNIVDKVSFKLRNRISAKASPRTENDAENTGRGMTVGTIYFDEFAFTKYNQIIYAAAAPAWSKAAEAAKKHGVPYSKVITTTPNNADDPSGQYCLEMINNAAKWNTGMLDYTETELRDFIESNSTNNFIFVQYSYTELGRDQAWFEKSCRDMNNDLVKIKRELLLEWPLSSDLSAFGEDELEAIHKYVRDPVSHMRLGNYVLDLYEPYFMDMNYIVSCDPSGGLSQDNSAITILHPADFHVVADFKNNKIDTTSLKELLLRLCVQIFPFSILVVENNNYGLPILNELAENRILEPRIYGEWNDNQGVKKLDSQGHQQRKKRTAFRYGVSTTSASRKLMFDLLHDIVREEGYVFTSPNLYSDVSTLHMVKNRLEAAPGFHDDNVMSYLIARYAIYYGTTMQNKYHISKMPTPSNAKLKLDEGKSKVNILSTIRPNVNTQAATNSSMSDIRKRAMEIQRQDEELANTLGLPYNVYRSEEGTQDIQIKDRSSTGHTSSRAILGSLLDMGSRHKDFNNRN